MALEDKIKSKEKSSATMSKQEEQDLKIAVLLAKGLIDKGGFDVIKQALESSKDPSQVIGQFLMQMAAQLDEKMPPEMKLSPTIYFAVGGWVEQISDYLQEEYKVDKKIMDRAEIYIATAAQKMAQGAAQQPPAGAPSPAAAPPAMPQGAPL